MLKPNDSEAASPPMHKVLTFSENTDCDRQNCPLAAIEPETIARLELLAKNRGTTVRDTLRQLVDVEASHTTPPDSMFHKLTPKQRTVLELLKSGLSVKEIAGNLSVSEETVRTHIIRARCRLDCPDLLSLRFQ